MTQKPTYEELEKRVENLEKNASELNQELMNLRKFKTISDKAGHGIVMRDLDGKFIYVNEAFAEMHGYRTAEITGKHLSVVHTKEQVRHIEGLRNEKNQREGYISEVGHKRRDSTLFPTLMTGCTIKDDEGKPLYLSATAIDITELKQTEEALGNQTIRNESILQTVMEKGFHHFEARHRHKGGRILDLEFSTNYMEIGDKRFFFFRDVTEQLKTERQLNDRNEGILIIYPDY